MYSANEKRYDKMTYNKCGESGLFLPKISLGLWQNFGDSADYDEMKDIALLILIWLIITGLKPEVPR